MSRKMRTITVPARAESTTEVQDAIICDLCKTEYNVSDRGIGYGENDFATRGYDVKEITIRFKDGTHYPEGSSGKYQFVDLCPSCWTNRLVPWFKRHNVEIHEREYDF